MKKYKLLRDLPHAKAGEVFEVDRAGEVTLGLSGYKYWLTPAEHPEWFEEVDGRWKPEDSEKYWTVDLGEFNGAFCLRWDDDSYDNRNYNSRACFKTKEEAVAASKKVKKLLLELSKNT